MSSAQIPIRLWIAFFTGRPWRGRMPPGGCSLPGSPRRCGAETGRILYDGALWRPITYGRLLLLLEPPAAGGSIVISGHFSARTSSQVSEFPGKLQSFPASRKPSGLSGTRFRSSRLSWRPDPLVPAQSAKAGRQGAVQHVSVKTCQSAYAAGLAGPRSRSGS